MSTPPPTTNPCQEPTDLQYPDCINNPATPSVPPVRGDFIPIEPPADRCMVTNPQTGDGNTEFGFLPCNVYTYVGEIVQVQPPTAVELPVTGHSLDMGLIAAAVLAAGVLARFAARRRISA